ncbi:MAG TPA: hypothetical protein VFZ59_09270 [Verrucomicrobiae bacterium]|nr:hypothetical protein [Verrucomicrobiae bacterium]
MRTLIIIVCVIVSVIVLTGTFAQRRALVSLRLEENKLNQHATETAESVGQPVASAAAPPAQHSPSVELLRLRGEVGQLERRKRELSNLRSENGILRTQVAIKGTNAPGVFILPADYIKKSAAKFAGYGTPEDTVQSLLAAIQNRDVNAFVEAFSPEEAERVAARIQSGSSPDEFFKEADIIPGLRIVKKDKDADDTVTLTVELLPGEADQTELQLKQFDGQWKLISGF